MRQKIIQSKIHRRVQFIVFLTACIHFAQKFVHGEQFSVHVYDFLLQLSRLPLRNSFLIIVYILFPERLKHLWNKAFQTPWDKVKYHGCPPACKKSGIGTDLAKYYAFSIHLKMKISWHQNYKYQVPIMPDTNHDSGLFLTSWNGYSANLLPTRQKNNLFHDKT